MCTKNYNRNKAIFVLDENKMWNNFYTITLKITNTLKTGFQCSLKPVTIHHKDVYRNQFLSTFICFQEYKQLLENTDKIHMQQCRRRMNF